jgi:hypothetical protein
VTTSVIISGVRRDLSKDLETLGVSIPSDVGCNAGELRHSMSQGCQMMEQCTFFKNSVVLFSVTGQLRTEVCLIISG